MNRPTPRRRKKTAAARLRPFWFLVMLVFVVAAGAAYFVATWPALRPHGIDVEGNHVVAKDEILRAARIDPKTNAWLQNTHAMVQRIEAIPYVDTVAVHRHPPSIFIIDVTERTPFARLVTSHATVIVDRNLRVLAQSQAQFDTLPAFIAKKLSPPRLGATLTETELVALRDDADLLANAHLAVATLEHDKFGDLVATLHSGVRVLFGEESDLAKKIALVDPILTQVGKAGRPISAIDLRAPGTPVVVYKGAER